MEIHYTIEELCSSKIIMLGDVNSKRNPYIHIFFLYISWTFQRFDYILDLNWLSQSIHVIVLVFFCLSCSLYRIRLHSSSQSVITLWYVLCKWNSRTGVYSADNNIRHKKSICVGIETNIRVLYGSRVTTIVKNRLQNKMKRKENDMEQKVIFVRGEK